MPSHARVGVPRTKQQDCAEVIVSRRAELAPMLDRIRQELGVTKMAGKRNLATSSKVTTAAYTLKVMEKQLETTGDQQPPDSLL
jgi:hypothetical protein